MKEVWKPIANFEGLYEVSNTGKVRSCDRYILCKDGKIKHYKERILKPGHGTYGRNQYTLSKDDKKYNIRGYRIVAETFLDNPKHLPEVNHIDGNNLNDNVNNLEWVSVIDNVNHAKENHLFCTYHKRKLNTYNKRRNIIMMKENTRKVFDYLKDNADKDLTAADVAEVLGLEKRQVDGIFTSALQRKNLGVREPAEVELADGSHQRVKYLRLTDEGLKLNPDED